MPIGSSDWYFAILGQSAHSIMIGIKLVTLFYYIETVFNNISWVIQKNFRFLLGQLNFFFACLMLSTQLNLFWGSIHDFNEFSLYKYLTIVALLETKQSLVNTFGWLMISDTSKLLQILCREFDFYERLSWLWPCVTPNDEYINKNTNWMLVKLA